MQKKAVKWEAREERHETESTKEDGGHESNWIDNDIQCE